MLVSMRCAIYRIYCVVILLALFYAWDWMPLRVLQRDVFGWSLRVSGYSPISFVYSQSPALAVVSKGDEKVSGRFSQLLSGWET